MSLVQKQVNYFFSSDETLNARNVSADGSTFSVQLNSPLAIPRDAVGASIAVTQANIWNNSYNISADIGNNIFTYLQGVTPYANTIPDGQYSVSDLGAAISRALVENGHPADAIVLTGDSSTSKIIMTVDSGYQVDFTGATSPFEIMGFTQVLVPAAIDESQTVNYAPNVARFNRVNSYLITSNILSNSIPTNSVSQGVIASVPIDVPSGSQIVYSPRHPIEIDATEMVSMAKNSFYFSLKDQSLRDVDTNDELWSFVLRLTYFVKV